MLKFNGKIEDVHVSILQKLIIIAFNDKTQARNNEQKQTNYWVFKLWLRKCADLENQLSLSYKSSFFLKRTKMDS